MSLVLPADSAVLVIDIQAAFFRGPKPPQDGPIVVGRINGLTAKARESRVPVIFIQHEEPDDDLPAFSQRWQLDPDLHVEPGDCIVRKKTCDAFFETSLETELGARHVDTLVVAGYATEFCIDSTVRAALSRNFRVVAVSDAHTTNNSPVLNARLIRDFHNWAWANCSAARPVKVIPAKDLIFPEAPKDAS
jgi:nicotinamidase-related amidase